MNHIKIQYLQIRRTMSSDVAGGEGGDPDLEPGHCTVFLHAEKFTSTISSQIFLLQIGEQIIMTGPF